MEMWKGIDKKGIEANCRYNSITKMFIIKVGYLNESIEKEFSANFEPIFGMDILDMNMSYKIAEELALIIEKKYNL